MKRFVQVLAFLIFPFIYSEISLAKSKEPANVITLSTLTNYAPYTFSHENKSILGEVIPPQSDSKIFRGFSWDIVRESFHARGHTLVLNVYPWSRAKAMFERGLADVLFPTTKTKERELKMLYPKYYTNASAVCVYTLKNQNFEYVNMKSLEGKSVGYRRSFAYGSAWDTNDNIKKVDVNSDLNGFYMLKAKRLDALITTSIIADKILEEKSMKSLFDKHTTELTIYEYIVALKSNKRSQYIIEEFEKGFEKIKASGKYKNIVAKWGQGERLGILPKSN